ncbi:MAG: 16S rRNA (cytidine(1402)-2'-O)-methyltransferase [Scrofimicrobium sp.]
MSDDLESMQDAYPGGVILLAATPIGNPGDASERLRQAILDADIVAAEDTRRFRGLCSRLGLSPTARVIALHDHNEGEKAAWLVQQATEGATVLVVSDAGTPTVSDPGFHLVLAAAEAGVRTVPLPGPSAALAALSVSGLPTDRFVFEGFLPRKKSEQNRRIAQLATEPRTIILFESPRRTGTTLGALAERLGGDRPAALCRELTKTYEEVRRGTLSALASYCATNEVLGEVTLVVGGMPEGQLRAEKEAESGSLAQVVLDLAESEGLRLKDAAAQVAAQRGVRKNQLMKAALELQSDGPADSLAASESPITPGSDTP